MKYRIECIGSKNEVFFAHLLGKNKNNKTINYKCGICSYADLVFDEKTKIILNINNNKCNVCKSLIQIKSED